MKREINKLDHNAAALKRWRTRLKRAMSMVEKLEKQRKRLEAKPVRVADLERRLEKIETVEPAKPEPLAVTVLKPLAEPAKPDNLELPSFLKRTPDPVAEQIKAEQEETKRRKARGRSERKKAAQRGDLKKMPLTGKAALEAIRNG
jgi:hypothetical protein